MAGIKQKNLATIVAAIIAAGDRRTSFPRPRTYTPGSRHLQAMTTRQLVLETQRRVVYNKGVLLEGDKQVLAGEYRRRGFVDAADMITLGSLAALADTAGEQFVDSLAMIPFRSSLGLVEKLTAESGEAGSGDRWIIPLSPGDLAADLEASGVPVGVIEVLDTIDWANAPDLEPREGGVEPTVTQTSEVVIVDVESDTYQL